MSLLFHLVVWTQFVTLTNFFFCDVLQSVQESGGTDTARYLRATLDTRLTWWPYIDQVRNRGPETGSVGSSPKQDEWSVLQERSSAV